MIVGIAGLKGSGKDTAGAYLVERYGFTRKSFAAPLKESFAALFDVSVEALEIAKNDPNAMIGINLGALTADDPVKFQTVRSALQRYGTEAHRDIFGLDFWTKMLVNDLLTGTYGDVVITDMRFLNETKAVKRFAKGVTFLIDRDPDGVTDMHSSESLPPAELIDYVIPNNGTLDDLHFALDDAIAKIRAPLPALP